LNVFSFEVVHIKLRDMFMFGFLIRLIFESYMDLSIACFLSIADQIRQRSWEKMERMQVTFWFSLLVLIAPFASAWLINKNSRDLYSEGVHRKIGSLYADLSLKTKMRLYYNPI
jgi:hypothetical protein